MTTKHGEIWWTELNTRDPEKARDFYSKVMGWTPFVASMTEMQRPAEPGEKSYTVFLMGETPICGLFDLNDLDICDEIPAHWLTYLAVDKVDESCRQIAELGGVIIKEPFDVPSVGRMAVVQDSTGAVFGLGTPEK
jgi:uncharacterized protein